MSAIGIILILLVLGGLAFFLYNYLQKKSSQPTPPQPPPPPSSDECDKRYKNSYRDDVAQCCKCQQKFSNYNYNKSQCFS